MSLLISLILRTMFICQEGDAHIPSTTLYPILKFEERSCKCLKLTLGVLNLFIERVLTI